VHERVRSHRRFEMLKAAAKAGLPLQVFGAGYERDLYRFKNVTYGGEATLAEVVALMRRSRIVLSVNANFGQGSHERPLSAMAAGAVAATDRSAFYEAQFGADSILQLGWTSLAQDLERLAASVDQADQLLAIAAKGHRMTVAEHRWDNRIDAILRAADAVR
jgi:spore maturation protein CgeB